MELSQKPKIFSQFFSTFSNFTFNLNILKKKMTLIADVFLNFVGEVPQKSLFRGSFQK